MTRQWRLTELLDSFVSTGVVSKRKEFTFTLPKT